MATTATLEQRAKVIARTLMNRVGLSSWRLRLKIVPWIKLNRNNKDNDDPNIAEVTTYRSSSTIKIVLSNEYHKCEMKSQNKKELLRLILAHEIIHAFLDSNKIEIKTKTKEEEFCDHFAYILVRGKI